MNAAAVSVALDLVSAILTTTLKLQQVASMLQKAQTENRELTPEEWAQIVALANTAESRLEKASS